MGLVQTANQFKWHNYEDILVIEFPISSSSPKNVFNNKLILLNTNRVQRMAMHCYWWKSNTLVLLKLKDVTLWSTMNTTWSTMVHGFHFKNLSLRSIFFLSTSQFQENTSCFFFLKITFRELLRMRLPMWSSLDQLASLFSLYVYRFIDSSRNRLLKEERELKVHPTFPNFLKEKGM